MRVLLDREADKLAFEFIPAAEAKPRAPKQGQEARRQGRRVTLFTVCSRAFMNYAQTSAEQISRAVAQLATAAVAAPADQFAVHQETDIPAPPARVYAALLDEKQFARITGAPARIESGAGGAFSLFGGAISGRNRVGAVPAWWCRPGGTMTGRPGSIPWCVSN